MRTLQFIESGGVYTIRTANGEQRTRDLETLIERADPGIEPEVAFKAARVIEHLLGPKQDGDHGQIQQGLVGG